jgi:hypothetical protein
MRDVAGSATVVDVDDVELVVELDVVVGSEVVVDSAVSSAGLHAARRRVSETNPAIAVRIRGVYEAVLS